MSVVGVVPDELRLPELGRLRLGARGEKGQPVSLETWRLTSRDRGLLEAVAQRVGGEVSPWEEQWELRTSLTEIEVVVPPGEVLSAWWELWSAAGCQRRCDGQRATVASGEAIVETDCVCLAEGLVPGGDGACSLTTRLTVLVPSWPGLGGWRLETGSEIAWREMTAQLHLLRRLVADGGGFVPATLAIEERIAKRPGVGTRRYRVPVLRSRASLAEVVGGTRPVLGGVSDAETPALPASAPAEGPDRAAGGGEGGEEPRVASPDAGLRSAGGSGTSRPPTSPVARSLAIACREAGVLDDEAHELCALVSGGQTRSRKQLTVAQAERIIGWLRDGTWRGRLAAAPLRARARAVRDAAPGLGDSLETWFRERFADKAYWSLTPEELAEFEQKIAGMEALVAEMKAEEVG